MIVEFMGLIEKKSKKKKKQRGMARYEIKNKSL